MGCASSGLARAGQRAQFETHRPAALSRQLTDISAEMGVLRTVSSRHPSFVSWNFRKSHGIDAITCVSFGDECDDAGRR
jgi:hypothetical protein